MQRDPSPNAQSAKRFSFHTRGERWQGGSQKFGGCGGRGVHCSRRPGFLPPSCLMTHPSCWIHYLPEIHYPQTMSYSFPTQHLRGTRPPLYRRRVPGGASCDSSPSSCFWFHRAEACETLLSFSGPRHRCATCSPSSHATMDFAATDLNTSVSIRTDDCVCAEKPEVLLSL